MADTTVVFDEASYWNKLSRFAMSAGESTVEKAAQLYYASHAPHTPRWARTVILGALAYFILPTDAVPDLLPGVGYVDDVGVLAAALGTVAMCITPEIKAKASEQVARWFRT